MDLMNSIFVFLVLFPLILIGFALYFLLIGRVSSGIKIGIVAIIFFGGILILIFIGIIPLYLDFTLQIIPKII